MRVLGWTRTSDHQVRNLALSPLSYEDVLCCGAVRALGAIRTRTYDDLNAVPLPLDHEGVAAPTGAALQAEDSNPQCPVQSRMCCRVTPACKGPAG